MRSPYCAAAAIAVVAFILCPPAGIVLALMVLWNWLDEVTTRPIPEPICWQHEDDTGLVTLKPCTCVETLPNGDMIYHGPVNCSRC